MYTTTSDINLLFIFYLTDRKSSIIGHHSMIIKSFDTTIKIILGSLPLCVIFFNNFIIVKQHILKKNTSRSYLNRINGTFFFKKKKIPLGQSHGLWWNEYPYFFHLYYPNIPHLFGKSFCNPVCSKLHLDISELLLKYS